MALQNPPTQPRTVPPGQPTQGSSNSAQPARTDGNSNPPSTPSRQDGGNQNSFSSNRENPPQAQPAANSGGPTHEEISRRAYEIYSESGFEHGRCEKNWNQAEEELRNKRANLSRE